MRKLPDGTVLFTLDEAEEIDFDIYDIYLHELVLIYFGLRPNCPVSIEEAQKGIYILYNELKERGYKVQDPHYVFIAGKPYSFVIERVINNLWYSGYLDCTETGSLKLTGKGRSEAGSITGIKIRGRDVEDLIGLRKILNPSMDIKPRDGVC